MEQDQIQTPIDKAEQARREALQMRERARVLTKDLENGFLELAAILYEVTARTDDGTPQGKPLYMSFGHKTFQAYVEEELNFNIRKAQRLRRVWFCIDVQLKELDPETKSALVTLGWSKVRELTRVLTVDNAKEWAEKSRMMTCLQLEEAIKEYGKQLLLVRTQQAIAQATVLHGPGLAADPSDPSGAGQEVSAASTDPLMAGMPSRESPLPEVQIPVPVPESFDWLHFKLYKGQMETVKDAMERAGQISGKSEKDRKVGHLLEMICADFLATNSFQMGGADEKLRFLKKLEVATGFRMIVLDAEGEHVVHGISHLQKLASLAGSHEEPAEMVGEDDDEGDDDAPAVSARPLF